jgi:hypothetical protein
MPLDPSTGNASVIVMTTSLTLRVSPDRAHPGELLYFDVTKLVDSNAAYCDGYVQVLVGTTWKDWLRVAGMSPQRVSGAVPKQWNTTYTVCRSWSFRYNDIASGQASNTVSVTVAATTRLANLTCDPSKVAPGESFYVKGVLQYDRGGGDWQPVAGKTVRVTCADLGIDTPATTGSDGSFSAGPFSTTKTGTFTITVSFAGATTLAPAVGVIQLGTWAWLLIPLAVIGAVTAYEHGWVRV